MKKYFAFVLLGTGVVFLLLSLLGCKVEPQRYLLSFDSDGGSAVDSQIVQEDDKATQPINPTKEGYTFVHWQAPGAQWVFTTPVTADMTLLAIWQANTDTSYKVEHYQQDTSGDGYTLLETDSLGGETETEATAVAKTYTGFIENIEHQDRIPSGMIAGDGSLVLKLYYDKDLHSVTFEEEGGSLVEDIEDVRYGSTVTEPSDPTKIGYTFVHWQASGAQWVFTTPVTADMTLLAIWQANTDTSYKVEHYQQDTSGDGYTLHATDSLGGETETEATAVAKTYTGFIENIEHQDRIPSGMIAGDGSLVLKLYYDKDLHSVTFEEEGGSLVEDIEDVRYGSTVTEPSDPTKIGYTFVHWQASGAQWVFTTPVTADMTLLAIWQANTDTSYKVEHYQQDTSGDGYTLLETDSLGGETETEATAVAKTYTGFIENIEHQDRIPSGMIAGDGSLVLKLYYDRDLHSVTFEEEGGSLVGDIEDARYGSTVTEPSDPTKIGYTFVHWQASGAQWVFTTPVTADMTLLAIWQANTDTSYKVEHYQQDTSGDGYTLLETDSLGGETETEATAVAKTYTGFIENIEHQDRIPSGMIAGDGSLVLKLYYDRDLHSVTFEEEGGSLVGDIEDVRYGSTVTEPSDPTKIGYTFVHWQASGAQWVFTTPVTADMTLLAIWQANTDTSYKVEHYQQDTSGDGYTLHATDSLGGETETEATAVAKTYTGFIENIEHQDRIPSGMIAGDGSLVLKLYYDRDLHSVTFEEEGGSLVEDIEDARYGSTVTLPTAPTKGVYTFGGWFTERKGGGSEFTSSTVVTRDIIVYAKWGYKVTFDSQGATVNATPSEIVAVAGSTIKTMPSEPEKIDYIFGGWFTEINGGSRQV